MHKKKEVYLGLKPTAFGTEELLCDRRTYGCYLTCLRARSALAGYGAGLWRLSSCETPAEKYKRGFPLSLSLTPRASAPRVLFSLFGRLRVAIAWEIK